MFKSFKDINRNAKFTVDRNKKYLDIFKPTIAVGKLQVDQTNRLFRISMMGAVILKYDELVDYELIQDDEIVTSGGLGVGRAVAGSIIAGPIGAVLGGLTKRKKTKKHITDLHIEITYKLNDKIEVVKLIFIKKKVKQGSLVHKKELGEAKKTLELLDEIVDDMNTVEQENSPADELMKYKQLLDMEVITQQEFDEVKERLLKQ